MSAMVMEAARLMEMLPEDDPSFVFEFIKKMVVAWDPDFIRLTPEEGHRLEQAQRSGFVEAPELDWPRIGT